MAELPPQLKPLSSIVARALELETIEPAVSYWCRYWVVQKSMELQKTGRSQEVESYLIRMLDQLESMKDRFAGTIEIEDRSSGKRKLETFALQVFENADREEKAKKATRSTSLKFLAAASFLDVCQVFGDPAKDLVDRRKYAKVQAMRIQSAIAAGKDPNISKSTTTREVLEAPPSAAETAELETLSLQTQPIADREEKNLPDTTATTENGRSDGPSGTDMPLLASVGLTRRSTNSSDIVETNVRRDDSYFPDAIEPERSDFPNEELNEQLLLAKDNSQHSEGVYTQVPSDIRATSHQHTSPVRSERGQSHNEVDADAIANAQKHAKWAISALNYEDIVTAVSELKKSLEYLGAQNL